MPSFKTADGKEYLIRIDAPKIRDCRSEIDIDLGALDFGKVAQQLANDPVLLVDTLWILCRKQCDAQGIDRDTFEESLVGDAIDAASAALIEARADFSPARMRSLILQQAETSERVRAQTIKMAAERLNDPKIEERILKASAEQMAAKMEEALTRFEHATNSPDNAASSQTD